MDDLPINVKVAYVGKSGPSYVATKWFMGVRYRSKTHHTPEAARAELADILSAVMDS